MNESEQRYRQLIRTSPAPINLFDASGEVLWGNDAVVDLLGLDSREELVGRSIFEFVTPADRYTAERELTEVVEAKAATGPTTMELERADGDSRTIRVATAPGRYEGRDIGQAVVVDVTRLERMRAALERERDFVEAALDALDDVFYVIDTAGDLERWNDALLEVSGYSEDDVRRMDVEEFFVDDDAERVSASIARAFAEGTDTLEATVRTRDGETIPYEFRKQRLTSDGQVRGLVGIGRDVSERRTRDRHLRTVDFLLQHQLRNQLNVVRGRAELLRDQVPEDAGEHLDALERAADSMLSTFDHHRHLVTQLTESPASEPLDVVSVLENVVADARESRPDAEFALDAPETARVSATPAVEYALRELLQNAVDHAESTRPAVDVTVAAGDDVVRVAVSDDGPPISKMEYSFLEDAPGDVRSTYHPSGLGIWSIHLAVRQSGGDLTIESTPGTGNTVTIELPAVRRPWE
ncbi:PAS domain-containing sensor histidine kinase [Halobacterium yunchengense]|uniref:PAS domain-containing sensor histidine kinase n=1 Tax=Halobacterium yunchengense TaxID=3108497 RepID=UPI00300AE912